MDKVELIFTKHQIVFQDCREARRKKTPHLYLFVYLFIYLYTLFIQKFQFSIASLNGDLCKIIRINYSI